ncbi:MAG: rhodanese-like domain-containing protein, partial [Burkholderiales bacterium]|nr:rhodanese-like domain-containing protein [Burkholderiales bacterium]
MDFITDNILLIFCFVGSALLLLLPYLNKSRAGTLSPADVVLQVNKNNAMLIDVRNKDQFETGSLGGAVNIPSCDLAAQLNSLPTDRPLIFICQDGRQAMQAAKQVKGKGFKDTHVLNGGINGWVDDKLPLTQPETAPKKPVRKKSIAARKAHQQQQASHSSHPT